MFPEDVEQSADDDFDVPEQRPEPPTMPTPEELWAEETQVLDQQQESALTDGKKRKRGALTAEEDNVIEVPGADGKMRRLEKPSSKRKSIDAAEPSEAKKSKKDGAPQKAAKKPQQQKKKVRQPGAV